MEKREHLEKLEQAHEEILSIIHDLKAPLNNISMIAALLQEELAEDKKGLLAMLEKSCQRSHEIIDDVLENSLAEKRNCRVAKEYQAVHQLVSKAVNTFYFTAQKKGIKIVSSLPSDLYAIVYPQKLQRAIENLLSNAIKFSKRDSQIDVSLYEEGGKFVIKVADSGIGMNEQQKERLCDKGKPVRRTGLEGEKSTGMGMRIVKKIVNQHKGEIIVESQESEGTTFFLVLPIE